MQEQSTKNRQNDNRSRIGPRTENIHALDHDVSLPNRFAVHVLCLDKMLEHIFASVPQAVLHPLRHTTIQPVKEDGERVEAFATESLDEPLGQGIVDPEHLPGDISHVGHEIEPIVDASDDPVHVSTLLDEADLAPQCQLSHDVEGELIRPEMHGHRLASPAKLPEFRPRFRRNILDEGLHGKDGTHRVRSRDARPQVPVQLDVGCRKEAVMFGTIQVSYQFDCPAVRNRTEQNRTEPIGRRHLIIDTYIPFALAFPVRREPSAPSYRRS